MKRLSPECVDMCSLKCPSVWWKRYNGCNEKAFPLNRWACAFWEYVPLWRNICTLCNCKAFLQSGFACRLDSKPASLIQRVVPLWTNKRIISAVNSHVGFQIGKFGTRVAALIAIVIFLCIRLNLVDFGYLGKFWFMICVFSVCWRLQSICITEKNKVIWSGPFHEVARCNDDNDDDDDRNIYLRNEYL